MEDSKVDLERGEQILRVTKEGMALCREGAWRKGLELLSYAVGARKGVAKFPSSALSFLGYGMARFLGKKREGLQLCEQAVEEDFFDPEVYLYLAKTQLFLRERRAAVRTLERGVQTCPDDRALAELREKVGRRRGPILGFLPRSHPANRFLGVLRHHLSRSE